MKHKIAQLGGLEDFIVETSKKPEVKEGKSQTDNVNLSDAEVQTDPGWLSRCYDSQVNSVGHLDAEKLASLYL